MNPAAPQVDDNVKYRYRSEMVMLVSNSHGNIIRVVDLIEREDAIILVYEYPVNGSLQSWLHQQMDAGQPLSWPERRAIAIDVAQGIRHLHHRCHKPIVQHNISPNNIFLDQNFKPVITGFDAAQMSMAGLGQPLPIMADLPPGNFGYAAPEYGNTASPMTEKVDTYSFGVLLLALVTGREANGAGANGHLAAWAHNFTELLAEQLECFESSVDKCIPDHVQAGRGLHRCGSEAKAIHADGSQTTMPRLWAWPIPWPLLLLLAVMHNVLLGKTTSCMWSI